MEFAMFCVILLIKIPLFRKLINDIDAVAESFVYSKAPVGCLGNNTVKITEQTEQPPWQLVPAEGGWLRHTLPPEKKQARH